MKVASIIPDDIVDCDDGVCVSFWVSGCPHKCKGCHNQELWDYNYGGDVERSEVIDQLCYLISKNGIERNFSVLGGEPLCPENVEDVAVIVGAIRDRYPKIKIYLWTGYTIEYLKDETKHPNLNYTAHIRSILYDVDVLIEGPFIESLKKLNLKLRGSTNQRVITNPKDYK